MSPERLQAPRLVAVGTLIRVQDWRQRLSSASSRPSTRPSRAVWGWACRSAGRSSKRTADDCGQARMCPAAPSFTSGCLSTRAAHLDWALGLSLADIYANIPSEAARVCQGARPRWVKGGCRRQVDGTAGLPLAPEVPLAPRQLGLVPGA